MTAVLVGVGLLLVYVGGSLLPRWKWSAGVAALGSATITAALLWPVDVDEPRPDPELVRAAGAAEARAQEAEDRLVEALQELGKTQASMRTSRARVHRALEGDAPANDLILLDLDRDASRLRWAP